MGVFYIYILKNQDGKIYIGQTGDLSRRVAEHNDPEGHGYTSKYRPWMLIYQEKVGSRKEAMGRERYLKTGIGRQWIKENILRA